MRRRAASPDPVVRETFQRHSATAADSLLANVELRRRDVAQGINPQRRALMGQFLTPAPVAAFMADMVETTKPTLHILDPGAGVGSLSAAVVASMCRRPRRPDSIALTAYEIDNTLIGPLRSTLDQCEAACDAVGIEFKARVVNGDFLEAGASTVSGNLFSSGIDEQFDWAILNPPYRKIRSASPERSLLRAIGIETSNLYTGFLGVVSRLLVPGGQMVAITPRSFCNGPYFEPFRRFLLRDMRFRRIHVFDTRNRAFTDDDVLQENVIFRAQRTREDTGAVVVSSSRDPNDSAVRIRTIKYDDLIHRGDPHSFIHIVPDGDGDTIRQHIMGLGASLSDLGLTVSTGRVVDFRAKKLLRTQPGRNTVPLIYPCHIRNGFVDWPSHQTRKPNALAVGDRADELLVPAGHYVLVKRFSSKEERRRIVAAVYDPDRVRADRVAFENHVNYYHLRGQGLPPTVAKGLVAFLNSTLVDSYFRQFSGHTQVNATDLRSFRYPTRERLVALGRRFGMVFPAQQELDRIVEDVILRG